ncbi:MAG TPA: ATP-grasp domain-containing protein [Pyrinomonadaceae bacterium]|nr:ATP-grasp domain-containing protein [Pyrinomonadaceae bacterium]
MTASQNPVRERQAELTDAASVPTNVVCIASYFKGEEFLRECKRQGAGVVLVTRRKSAHENWPRESLDDLMVLPDDASPELVTHAVSQFARPVRLNCVVALEEFDVLTAALVREHLGLPGMDASTARGFRDKLTMRAKARGAGIRVPDFVHLLNYQEVGEFMERVTPPWVLKPRSDVSSSGVRKVEEAEHVWRGIEALDAREALQDKSTYYLLEQFVPGEVFHVDSVVEGGKVLFAGASRYGRPPLEVVHGGGVYTSYTVEYDSLEHVELLDTNRRLLAALGLERGAAHAEFIKCDDDGQFYFLEVAARVGGAFTAETLEAASGVNLWREWARVELAHARGERAARPHPRREYGGIALSLARQERPDTSPYDDPEIVQRVEKPNHVGLIVRSKKRRRVEELLAQYAERFARDFSAYVPPPERRGLNL